VILIAAAYYALTQVKEARRARMLAIVMPLRYELDSLESRQNRYTLFNELPENLTSLTDEQDLIVDRVVVEYDNIGSLVINDLIDFQLMAALYSKSTERCWRRVKQWVEEERGRRGGASYAEPFEMFATRCIEYNAQRYGGNLQPFSRADKHVKGKKK
jgi:hypothetical protein